MQTKKTICFGLIFSILLLNSCVHTTKMIMNKNEIEPGDIVVIQMNDDSVVKMMIKKVTAEYLIGEKKTVKKSEITFIEKESGNPFTFYAGIIGILAIGAFVWIIYDFNQI